MTMVRSASAILSVGLGISAVAMGGGFAPPAGAGAPATSIPRTLFAGSVDPRHFGTQDYTITVLSALQFGCPYSNVDQATLSLNVYYAGHCYTPLDLPAGAVIDYIGVNSANTGDAVLGFHLQLRDHVNGATPLVSFSIPYHEGFVTDYVGALGILIPANLNRAYVLDIERAPGPTASEYVGYVEIWWRRVVSDPPATRTFGDVTSSHPFYQFIEALAKSGITGGCGGGNFCPDAPLTRGQMAVFLSKALGLQWAY